MTRTFLHNTPVPEKVSVIIPTYNAEATIGRCLSALLASSYGNQEVIVVDDASTDRSAEIARGYPVTLIMLQKNSGPSIARNAGAAASTGTILFFTDADCIVRPDTLDQAVAAIETAPGSAVGGSYTPLPHDQTFFSMFQSIFINHFELKNAKHPDYLATHALAMKREIFDQSGGFRENLLTRASAIEDVEFSHRLRRQGFSLVMDPRILVEHVFGYSLMKSIRNAFRKAKFWTAYSLGNRDLMSDSGTASRELKANVVCSFGAVLLVLVATAFGLRSFLAGAFILTLLNLSINRRLIAAFGRHAGGGFAVTATAYYVTLYAVTAGCGALAGAAAFAARSDRSGWR